jgi:hypothetical protein
VPQQEELQGLGDLGVPQQEEFQSGGNRSRKAKGASRFRQKWECEDKLPSLPPLLVFSFFYFFFLL